MYAYTALRHGTPAKWNGVKGNGNTKYTTIDFLSGIFCIAMVMEDNTSRITMVMGMAFNTISIFSDRLQKLPSPRVLRNSRLQLNFASFHLHTNLNKQFTLQWLWGRLMVFPCYEKLLTNITAQCYKAAVPRWGTVKYLRGEGNWECIVIGQGLCTTAFPFDTQNTKYSISYGISYKSVFR